MSFLRSPIHKVSANPMIPPGQFRWVDNKTQGIDHSWVDLKVQKLGGVFMRHIQDTNATQHDQGTEQQNLNKKYEELRERVEKLEQLRIPSMESKLEPPNLEVVKHREIKTSRPGSARTLVPPRHRMTLRSHDKKKIP